MKLEPQSWFPVNREFPASSVSVQKGLWLCLPGAGSQTHGVGFPYVRALNSLLEPSSKLFHGVQGDQLSLLKCLSVPTVTLAHRPQVHGCTVAAQVAKVVGPHGRSPERHCDAPQSERHGAAGHVTRRRRVLGSVGFGTNFAAVVSAPRKEEFVTRQARLSGLNSRSQ